MSEAFLLILRLLIYVYLCISKYLKNDLAFQMLSQDAKHFGNVNIIGEGHLFMNRYDNHIYMLMLKEYNDEFTRQYNQLIEEYNIDFEKINNEDAITNSVNNNMQEWFRKPFSDEYPDDSADKIIDSIIDIDDAIELASYAAIYCDNDIPDQIKIKLCLFGAPVIREIERFIMACDWGKDQTKIENDDNKMIICSSFIKLLSEWQCFDSHKLFISKFAETVTPNEIIADAIRYYLCACGETAIPVLISCLAEAYSKYSDPNASGEYLLISLTDIGKSVPSNEIYLCLKDCFRKMSNKVIGVICIGDYGDGRGVQLLKGWLDRHKEENDRQLISEILSSIKRLGGEISDIQHRLKLNSV